MKAVSAFFNFPLAYLVIRNTLFREIEYRIHYWILIISYFVSFFSDYLILKLSYATGRESFLNQHEVFAFVFWGLVVRNSSTLWQEVMTFSTQIKTGEFRRFLLQPIRFYKYFAFSCTGEKAITWPLNIFAFIVVRIFFSADVSAPHHYFWLLFLCSFVLTWSLYYTFTLVTFWIEDSHFLIASFNLSSGIFAGSLLPFDWLPDSLQSALRFTPFRLLGDIPIRAALGKLSPQEYYNSLMMAALWMLVLFSINAYLFSRGTLRYESHGG